MQHPRVLHVLDHSRPIVSGYSMRSHAVLCAQRAMGFAPVALTSPKHAAADGDALIDGIEYLRSSQLHNSRTPVHSEGQLMVQLAHRLAYEVAHRGISLLHAHSPVLNGLPALWVARRARIPLV